MLDRMDICVDVEKLDYGELLSPGQAESSESVRERVIRAQRLQRERFKDRGILFNSQMGQDEIDRYCMLSGEVKSWFADALRRLDISARSYTRILRVARTIADIDGKEGIGREHLAEAIQLNNSYILN